MLTENAEQQTYLDELDLRLTKQPRHVTLPLYPFTGSFPSTGLRLLMNRNTPDLAVFIADCFGSGTDHVLLGSSGTAVLVYWLAWLREEYCPELAVALPSFFCAETVLAIAGTGIRVVLLDISEQLGYTGQSLDFAARSGCQVLIWPNYFGYRLRDNALLQQAENSGMLIVLDEAHTFPPAQPYAYTLPRGITLFSFACNKPLAAAGGGGLHFADREMAWGFKKFLRTKRRTRNSEFQCFVNECAEAVRNKIRWWNYTCAARLGLYRDHPAHRSASTGEEELFNLNLFPPLTPYQASMAAARWKMRQQCMTSYAEYVHNFATHILEAWQSIGVRVLTDVLDTPAIFAVRVPSALRYPLSAALAQLGIQTTWHYFPIHRLKAFAGCQAEPMPVSDQMASEILVLPCQWVHSALHLQLAPSVLAESLRLLGHER